MSEMMNEVKQVREDARVTARTGEGGTANEAEELPEGSSPLEAREETAVESEGAAEEAPEAAKGDAVAAAGAESDPIIIGDQTFTSEKEALKYAQKKEQERLLEDAHAAGIREALEAQAARTPAPEPEDDFETRFYSNPKETLRAVKEEAKREALQAIQQERHRENLWTQFLEEFPDVRRKDAERILQENADTIGQLKDLPKAMKLIAQKVRSEYEEIASLTKPRTALAEKRQVLSPSGGSKGVTPAKKEDAPLAFAAQMRAAFKR